MYDEFDDDADYRFLKRELERAHANEVRMIVFVAILALANLFQVLVTW